MDRQNFYFGKLVDVPEMRDLQNNIENGINFIKAMLGKGIWKGGNLVIANLNLTIDDTVCFDNVGNTIFIGSQVFNMANFIPPTDKKIVSITASFTRNYSQAEQDDLGNNVYFQEDEGCQINYIESDVTESPAVSIIPDSQVLIADVTLTAGQTEIITENISFDRIKRLDQFGRKLIDVFSYIENHSALHEDLFYNKPTLDNAFSSYLKKNANLSDLINKSVARDNLGVPAIGQTMLRFITDPTLRKDVQWVENIDTIRTTGFFSTGALDDATWVIIHMERNGRGVQLRIGSGLNTGLIEIRNRNGDINNTTWENWIGLAKTSEVNNKISKVPSIETIDDTGMEDGMLVAVDKTNKKLKILGNVKIGNNSTLQQFALNGIPYINVYRVNGSFTAPTHILSGDIIGLLQWGGYIDDVGTISSSAAIRAQATGDWASSTNKPTDIIFYTASTTQTTTERARLTSVGFFGLGLTPAHQLQLSTDDAYKPTTNTWGVTSDERIKENIVLADLDRCYEIVKNLPLKHYKWKFYDEKKAPDQSMLGWIAQDVKSIFPKAVTVNPIEIIPEIKEVIKEEILDKDGKVIKQAKYKIIQEREVIEDGLGLNPDQIFKALYGSVQKLMEKVEEQERRINDLEILISKQG